MDNSKKFIRTINDKILLTDLKGGFVLPYEHIIQNICDYIINKNGINPSDLIALTNINEVKAQKFCYLSNLNLESNSLLIADELNALKENNCELILDVTTLKNGQNLKTLREISKLTNIKICFGYTFKEDFLDLINKNSSIDFNKIHADLRYELTYGFDEFIPSFFGEFFLYKNFPSEIEKKYFDILIKLSIEFGIPIFFKLNHYILDENFQKNFKEYFEFYLLDNFPNFERKKITFAYSNDNFDEFDVKLYNHLKYKSSELEFLKEFILNNGFSLILNIYDCDLVIARDIKNNTFSGKIDLNEFLNVNDHFSIEKLNLIVELLKEKKFKNQIMISNNINFKCQLKKYGGNGYTDLFKRYMDKIIKLTNLNKEFIDFIFRENLIQLLCWWEPPKLSEKTVKKIDCQFCKKSFPETEEHFNKMDFNYCSIKCMNEHRKNNYQ